MFTVQSSGYSLGDNVNVFLRQANIIPQPDGGNSLHNFTVCDGEPLLETTGNRGCVIARPDPNSFSKVDEIIEQGCAKAQTVARETMGQVYDAIGL